MSKRPISNLSISEFLSSYGPSTYSILSLDERKSLVHNEIKKIEEEERKIALKTRQKLIIERSNVLKELVPDDDVKEHCELYEALDDADKFGRWPENADLEMRLVRKQ